MAITSQVGGRSLNALTRTRSREAEMQKTIPKSDEAPTWANKLLPIVGELPTAMVALGVALTPLWAAAIFWFLFNWLLWRILY